MLLGQLAASQKNLEAVTLALNPGHGPCSASTTFADLLPHRRMLPNSSRLLIDAHRPDVNRSLLTIGPTAFG